MPGLQCPGFPSFLSLNQPNQCEGLLTLGECHSALLGMARRKAPGSHGLPLEFYIHVDVSSICGGEPQALLALVDDRFVLSSF